MNLSVQEIKNILKAEGTLNSNQFIDTISVDSRSLQNKENTLFFALSGPNYNAHQFIPDLISRGVHSFVVSVAPQEFVEDANFLVVDNVLIALQQLAVYYRSLFEFPVVGITGSNGKTIVKEWLNFLLSPDYNIIRSPKSYNSQVGVPLSVLSTNERHNFGIFEAGISTVNEMKFLAPIIKPTIGVFTNIGSSHNEGFENIQQKIAEKLQLFDNSEILILEESEEVRKLIAKDQKTFSWSGNNTAADVLISSSKIENSDTTNLSVKFDNQNFEVNIPFQDDASIQNAISCLMVLLYLKYDVATIQSRLSSLYKVEMRLQLKNGINRCVIVDDSYSSDFQSLKIALDFLESQKKHLKKTVIISDIYQSGLPLEEVYRKVASLMQSNQISRVIGIGEVISSYEHLFENIETFASTADFLEKFEEMTFADESILVKGARSFKFEKVVLLLAEKNHETVLEINLNAIAHNVGFFKSKLAATTKLMVMVKAFAYGSGGFEIAKLLEYLKVDYLGVAFADEGISLRNAGLKIPIMVLNPENSSFPSIITFKLEAEIYSIKGLKAFIKVCEEKKVENYPIHIKIDTGMHRLGFEENTIDELIEVLKHTTSVKVQSILSHLATSDNLEDQSFAHHQLNLFEKLSSRIISDLGISPLRHILNTSGISNFPEHQYDMVRLGIGTYGISNDPAEQKYLQNVSTLKSIISQIRTISQGESVGYSQKFIAEKITRIATIPIGYADGIDRGWGNKVGYVMINNQKAEIVGNVCMDMLMADCSDIQCKEGDEVEVFGENPTVIEMAEALNTIPYEVLTGVSQRVKRVFYRE